MAVAQGRARAEARGLSTQELEDRLATDLGVDEQGSQVHDFDPRQFKGALTKP